MLTVCIPVYNSLVFPLVNELLAQSQVFGGKVKILVIDDCSNVEFHDKNGAEFHDGVQYITLEENIGRSRIRNHFLKFVQTPYMLFLDGDVAIEHDDFIARYMELLHGNRAEVACGGHIYNFTKPERKYLLRWKYGITRETKSLERSLANPYQSFKTSNFLISTQILREIQFNENITGYGHEDTLFGHELRMRKVKVDHLQNPVHIHHFDTNKEFIAKVSQSVLSLAKVTEIVNADSRFANDVKLLKIICKIKRNGFAGFFAFIAWLKLPVLKWILSMGIGSMGLLDLYKLLFAFKGGNHHKFKCK